MKHKLSILFLMTLLAFCASVLHAAGLENHIITISSNDRFDLIDSTSIQFKFQPLSDKARTLDITENASSLGVTYLGQARLKENITTLSVLRSIAGQIGDSLNLSFGVISDSNTSEALNANELLLLYHPDIAITLALIKSDEQNYYEIICTYALKDLNTEQFEVNTTDTPTTVSSDDESNVEANQKASANE